MRTRMQNSLRKEFVIIFLLSCLCSSVFSATVTFTGTGNWSDGTKWSGGSSPSNTDDAIIDGTCTYDPASATCASLTINSTRSIDIGANTLTITGDVSGAGTLSISSGTLNIGGNNTHSGTFNEGTGTVVYNGNSAQTVRGGITYANLQFSGSGVKNQNGDITISTSLSITNTTLSISTNTLTINGTIAMTGTGALTGSETSNLIIGGSASAGQSILMDQSSASTYTLNNLTINRSSTIITLSDNTNIDSTLTITSGTLATSDKLTLLSNTTSGTANLAPVTGTISGDVIVQRFIPSSGRRWRFIATPVSNATFEDWRSDVYITGAGTGNTIGSLNSNGFDATATNNPSAYWYDETVTTGNLNDGWVAITNATSSLTNVPITVGKGYRVYIRGDRSNLGRLDGSISTQNIVTLHLKGTVNTGSISIPVSFTSSGTAANDGWSMGGNPYPSAYDWNKHYDSGTNFANIDPVIYMFDGSTNSYKSYNALSDAGTLVDGILPSGCSFFVKATASSPSLTFIENNKSSVIPLGLYKTANTDLRISLSLDSVTNDEMVIAYRGDATDGFDKMDNVKMNNPDVNISSICTGDIKLSVDARPSKGNIEEKIPLYVQATNAGTYKLSITGASDVYPGTDAWIVDKYTGNKTDIKTTTEINLTIDPSNPLTFGTERLYLLTGENPATGIADVGLTEKNYAVCYDGTSGQLIIHHNEKESINEVIVYDAMGRSWMEFKPQKQNDSVTQNAIGLPPGIYFVNINRSVTLRFVK